jgi:Protein of unknown function (DUF3460)
MGKISQFKWNVPHMSIFARPDYSSEVTQFIDSLKKANPELEASQRAGRALLWEKPVDRQAQAEQRAARVPQKPYVYQTNA